MSFQLSLPLSTSRPSPNLYPAKPRKNITGQRFGRLIALEFMGKTMEPRPDRIRQRYFWKLICDCGNTVTVDTSALLSNTNSCGCLQTERRITHGLWKSSEYKIWAAMKQRCLNPNNGAYSRYGAEGIGVCKRWQESFEHFYSDMGPRPSMKHSLDRIDNERGYEPDNCRWAPTHIQHANRRPNKASHGPLTFNGKTLPFATWARKIGMSASGLAGRLASGWTLESALTCPPYSQPRRKRRS